MDDSGCWEQAVPIFDYIEVLHYILALTWQLGEPHTHGCVLAIFLFLMHSTLLF